MSRGMDFVKTALTVDALLALLVCGLTIYVADFYERLPRELSLLVVLPLGEAVYCIWLLLFKVRYLIERSFLAKMFRYCRVRL